MHNFLLPVKMNKTHVIRVVFLHDTDACTQLHAHFRLWVKGTAGGLHSFKNCITIIHLLFNLLPHYTI